MAIITPRTSYRGVVVDLNAHMLTKDEVLKKLAVDINGLKNKEISQRKEKYGENKLSSPPKVSTLKKILKTLIQPLNSMLLIAALIAGIICIIEAKNGQKPEYLEVVGILIAVLLSSLITVAVEYKSKVAFEKLSENTKNPKVKTKRQGQIEMIDQEEIVVGDIVHIEAGVRVVCDGRLIKTTELELDESILTGETKRIKKNENIVLAPDIPVADRFNMVYSGTYVANGNGVLIATSVGDNTEIGKIAKALSPEPFKTPLEEKLEKLGQSISIFAALVAIFVFALKIFSIKKQGLISLKAISDSFLTSVAIMVAAVPEGLPTIVAASLAFGVSKLAKENALVKKMSACETIGSINVICSDKTGTLTENKMTVEEVFCLDGHELKIMPLDEVYVNSKHLVINSCINSTAELKSFIKEDNSNNPPNVNEVIGNPTEGALLKMAQISGIRYDKIRNEYKALKTFPFSSESKYMTTIVLDNKIQKDEQDDLFKIRHGVTFPKKVIYIKGSPEIILKKCDVSWQMRHKIEKKIKELQLKSLRVIAFSHKNLEIDAIDFNENERITLEKDMIYDGFCAIGDPLREDIKENIAESNRAGIELKILTGDGVETAKAIGNELGIISEKSNKHAIIEAHELEKLNEKDFSKAIKEVKIVARSTPSLKMRIVTSLKKAGSTVAVIGDGVNDAPALKNADVGIAMGITGTEVSKEASDMILLDDSFSTVVKAIGWGRGIYQNFERFITFQLTANLSSIMIILLSAFLNMPTPFTTLQILWINLIMDGPPALTLGLRPFAHNLLDEKPIDRKKAILTKNMKTLIFADSIFIAVLVICQTRFNIIHLDNEHTPTVIFTLFIILQIFNALNCSEPNMSIFKGFRQNGLIFIAFGVTFLLQYLITICSGSVFQTAPITISAWGKIVALAFSVVLFSEVVKLTFTKKTIVSEGQ